MNKHVKIMTYLKTVWPDIVFVQGTDDDYINQICDYTEEAEHDDAPDSLSSILKVGRFRVKPYQPRFSTANKNAKNSPNSFNQQSVMSAPRRVSLTR